MPRLNAWAEGASTKALTTWGVASTSPIPTRPSSVCTRPTTASCDESHASGSTSGFARTMSSSPVIFIGLLTSPLGPGSNAGALGGDRGRPVSLDRLKPGPQRQGHYLSPGEDTHGTLGRMPQFDLL